MLSLMFLAERPKNVSRAHRELEDLIRKLFSKYEQIAFSQLLWQKRGRIALKVYAFEPDKMDQFIIKLGRKESIHSAYQSFEEAVQLAIGPVRTSRAFSAETLHFAAEAWILDSIDLEEAHTLTEHYMLSNQKGVRSAFESLCQITLAPWVFFDPDKAETKTLIDVYQKMLDIRGDSLSPEVLRQKIAALVDEKTSQGMVAVKSTDNRLTFHFVSKTSIDPLKVEECPHPANYLLVDHWLTQRHVPVQPTLTHLGIDDVLVDGNGNTWLSDIFQVKAAPRFYPYLMLENQVRFELFEVNSLRRRYDLEKCLLATASLAESIPPAEVESDSRKALIAIQAIRQAAAHIYGDDRISYYSGLLFFTMKGLEKYNPKTRYTKAEMVSLLHRFILASLLCQKIEALQEAPDPWTVKHKEERLVINDVTGEVVVGNRRVHLSPLEYQILLYLYERAGQLCQREDIVKHVWGIKEPKKKDINSLLNSHLNRMREEIEPQRSKPQYLCTLRGKGIILNLEPD
jgi:DNA-binding winged helix-turn-helix (wHTH) protein